MKKILLIAFLCSLPFGLFAQKAVLMTEGVTPHSLTTLGLTTNSVSAGMKIIPNGTYCYLSPMNVAADLSPVLTATYEFIAKPSGSVAAFESIASEPLWKMFKADVKGEYQVKLTITTALGTDDTTMSLYSGSYVGVGGYEGVAAAYPNCMSCHASMPAFVAIFDKWKVSGHATIFKTEITTGAAYYSTSCMKCHTTGYDHHLAAANNGFDDVAASLGWVWQGPPNPGKWDTLKTQKPGLVNHATIGCEMCHGAGSEHAAGGAAAKIQKSTDASVCAQCHDEPWRHNKYSEFEHSGHAEAVYETSWGTRTLPAHDMGQCMRCHDGRGYILYSKGLTTTSPIAPTLADHTTINCATCHDPHGNTYTASLRQTPVTGDTLGNGYNYTAVGGTGQTCMSCHKARRNGVVYQSTSISSTWGPHHSVQSDVFLGQNAVAVYDTLPYATSYHRNALANACVDCHMYPTADTGTVNRDKVGGHTWHLRNAENNYQHTKACESCHGPKTTFDDFVAAADYDADGNIESVQNEVKGLSRLVRLNLPPIGQDTIIWSMIKGNADSVKFKKAYWNYQLIEYDGSYGMHNAKFAISVLSKTVRSINGGFIPVELMSFAAKTSGSSVILNWETATETNNKGFAVERNINGTWNQIAFVNGKGTSTVQNSYTYTDNLVNVKANGSVSYRLKQVDLDGTTEYSKVVFVNINNMPREFSLDQNYPNPFNPSTSIKFTVPVSGNVKVAVYNAMGKLVKELVNADFEAGSHSINWNGDDNSGVKVASGIYFYKMDAGNRTFTKKMVLMK